MVDHYSKWVVVVPVKDLTAKTTAQLFYSHWVQVLGCPEPVLTDRGAAFEAHLFQELCHFHYCKKLRTTAYHPQENGLCEKINQVFLQMLRVAAVSRHEEWPKLLPELLEVYNNTVHCSTGYTPFYLMMGRHGQLPNDRIFGLQAPINNSPQVPLEWVSDHQRRIQEAKEIVSKKMGEAQARQQQEYNRKATAQPLHVGDRVWMRKFPRTHKLDSLWETEPYEVIEVPYPNSAVYKVWKPGFEPVVHRNRLKLCQKKDLPVDSTVPVAPLVTNRPTREYVPVEGIHLSMDIPMFSPGQVTFLGLVPNTAVLQPSRVTSPAQALSPTAPEYIPVPRSPALPEPEDPPIHNEEPPAVVPEVAPEVPSEEVVRVPETENVFEAEVVLRRFQRSTQGQIPIHYQDVQLCYWHPQYNAFIQVNIPTLPVISILSSASHNIN
ncbi:LOW QUALITY PROTEIN: uncharacterized protein PAF06_014883 [Gastrophryne carolinensis]